MSNKLEREKEIFYKGLEGLTNDQLKDRCWELRQLLKARYGGKKSNYSEETLMNVQKDLRDGLLSYKKIAEKHGTSVSYVQRAKIKMMSGD